MSGASWAHRLVRPLVRPMIGTRIRPNHLTTLRLLSGLGAGALIAAGSRDAMDWGGVVWLVSALLDRADGELARLGNLGSHAGHVYDFYCDFAVNSMLFVGIGMGLRRSWLGPWAIPLGVVAGATLLAASIVSERLERRSAPGVKAYTGKWGLEPDDAMFLLAPLTWLGWLPPILLAATFGAATLLTMSAVRLARSVAPGAPPDI